MDLQEVPKYVLFKVVNVNIHQIFIILEWLWLLQDRSTLLRVNVYSTVHDRISFRLLVKTFPKQANKSYLNEAKDF